MALLNLCPSESCDYTNISTTVYDAIKHTLALSSNGEKKAIKYPPVVFSSSHTQLDKPNFQG